METNLSSVQVVRLLAEEDRRKVVAALILSEGPCDTSQIAEATGLVSRTVIDACGRLLAAGLIRDDAAGFELVDQVFQLAARAEVAPSPPSDHDDQSADVARVLDMAFKNGKLVQWPAKRTKRLVVLDYLSQQFDIGKRYEEAEVNDRLRVFDDDVATMRRYLVDEQFLDRGAGEYWRCGGSF